MTSGLVTISVSSAITIGFVAEPAFSSITIDEGIVSLAFLHVAWRAKQARWGAPVEVDEAVDTEEIDEARDDVERSEIIDSGLERVEVTLAIDGLREENVKLSLLV